MSAINPQFCAPIEFDKAMEREYIPMPGGWEIQTKGGGSTFRICDKNGDRLAIPDSPYLHEELTRMARDVNTASIAFAKRLDNQREHIGVVLETQAELVSQLVDREEEIARLQQDAKRYRWLRDSGGDVGFRVIKFNEPGSPEIDASIDAAMEAK